MRHDLGVLWADMMKRFDQSATTTATLQGRVNQAEDNLNTLNDTIHQWRNGLDGVATDVRECRRELQMAKDAVTQAVAESQLYLRDKIGDLQTTIQ